MRKLCAIAALAALGVSTAAAQSRWTAEIGIQGGYSKIKPAGTGLSDAISAINLPGSGYVLPLLSFAPLYAIIPAGQKLAIEPQLSFTQTGGETFARLGLRGDYAMNQNVYLAAGGVLNYAEEGSPSHTQLGAQVGVGYRKRLVGPINARLEGNVTVTKKSNLTQPTDAYSVLLGISTSVGGHAAQPARARSAARAWDPAIGFSGGYFNAHGVGTGLDISGFALPAPGISLYENGGIAPTPPTMFVIIPMGQKAAIEPGVDIRYLKQGSGHITAINVSGRIDYAVVKNWYGAVGGALANFSATGTSGSITGATVAWGYRFHLAGVFAGRAEANYSLYGKSSKLGTPAINTLGLMFGAMMPLK